VLFKPGQKPTLLFNQPNDFWHKPPDDPSGFWVFDTVSREQQCLVSSEDLLSGRTFSDEDKANRERKRITQGGIVEYHWSPDGERLLIPLEGHLYLYNLATAETRRLTNDGQYITDAQFSPDASHISYVRSSNLWLVQTATGKHRQLTFDGSSVLHNGLAEFVAQEEMHRFDGYWWSPDSRAIAFVQVDESAVTVTQRYEIDADNFSVFNQRYPYAGTANAEVKLGTITLETGAVSFFDLDFQERYLARVNWLDSSQLIAQVQDRKQQQLQVVGLDAISQTTSVLFEETSDTWVNLQGDVTWIADRQEFLWISERSGFAHLYLYNRRGELQRQLTQGSWNVLTIKGTDRKHVYFEGYLRSPLERHLYRVDMTTGDTPTQLTQSEYSHSTQVAPTCHFFIDHQSSAGTPAGVSIRRIEGQQIAELTQPFTEGHALYPYKRCLANIEFGELASTDGQTLHFRLAHPQEKQSRHPAILIVYGGPGVQTVMNEWTSPWVHYLTQQGFAVMQLDNRGSANRGTRFEAPIYGQLGEVEVMDQLVAVDYLKSLDWIDAQRLGVFGHSYGGYMTLMLMFKAPGIFKAGISVAPVSDWRLYDTHYTERYLGLPQDNEAGYRASSVFDHIRPLQGNLLIVHGMADDNVLFTNSTRIFKALQDANIQFDMMTYPGAKHGLSGKSVNIHRYTMMDDFFSTHLGHSDE
jgi:dipeptidyl-peptidase 4